jgi:hypothetical protein
MYPSGGSQEHIERGSQSTRATSKSEANAAIRLASCLVSSFAASRCLLFVSAKHVADAGSDGEHAQCFMRGQCFIDP